MTDEITQKNDEPRAVSLSEMERNNRLEAVKRDLGASTEQIEKNGIDIDAYYADRMFMFSSARRRRASFIL